MAKRKGADSDAKPSASRPRGSPGQTALKLAQGLDPQEHYNTKVASAIIGLRDDLRYKLERRLRKRKKLQTTRPQEIIVIGGMMLVDARVLLEVLSQMDDGK